MNSLFKAPEAVSLAVHALAYLASLRGRKTQAQEIASRLNVSSAHMSKVLQRLARAGLLCSTRGPRGGFTLDQAPEHVVLLEVFEAMEGPLKPARCLMGRPVCQAASCVFQELAVKMEQGVREQLGRLTLADLAGIFGEDGSPRS
ncbi:MAG: Rrf2 family transcriptional regulator [Pseudomonadota bacterium]